MPLTRGIQMHTPSPHGGGGDVYDNATEEVCVLILLLWDRPATASAGKLVLSRNWPRTKGHSVIPAPRTTRTQ